MTTIKRRIGSHIKRAFVVIMFALAFAFLPGAVLAQTQVTTPGGTIGKIPKWTAGAEIQNSVITESNSNIGIGNSNPLNNLDIFGTTASQLHLSSNNSSDGLYLFANGNHAYYLGGATFDGSQWVAKAAGVAALAQADGAFVFYSNTGLSPGAFTPTERARLDVTGNFGIGTATPVTRLEVAGSSMLRAPGPVSYLYDTTGAANARQFYFWNSNGHLIGRWVNDANSAVVTESITFLNNGSTGIGTTTPHSWAKLHVRSADAAGIVVVDSGSTASQFSNIWFMDRGIVKWELAKAPDNQFGIYDTSASTYRAYFKNDGTVGIGTTNPQAKLDVAGNTKVTGDITVAGSGNITALGTISGGNIIAKYQDLAEWVPASHTIPAGTVVTLDPARSNHVQASSHAYDTRIAGVVSARPGVILGEAGEGKVMVATTGRVRVRVDAGSGPIRVGDLLVTSDKEGVAMRSQPLDLGGTPIHRPGTLIGKALEPLEKGVGEILVLLSLQ